MDGILERVQSAGLIVKLTDEGRLLVGGDLTDTQTAFVSKHRDEILHELRAETVLRDFVDLVRATGACDHQILFSHYEIRAELDDEAAEDLLTTTREVRQAWATAIATRIARARLGPEAS
jgi:hypothetical protein